MVFPSRLTDKVVDTLHLKTRSSTDFTKSASRMDPCKAAMDEMPEEAIDEKEDFRNGEERKKLEKAGR